MRLWSPCWHVAPLAALAILFAPASDEWRAGGRSVSSGPVEARMLAPTVREAVVSAVPKLSAPHVGTAQGPGSVPLALAAAATALLLTSIGVSARSKSRPPPHLVASRTRIARGPPASLAV